MEKLDRQFPNGLENLIVNDNFNPYNIMLSLRSYTVAKTVNWSDENVWKFYLVSLKFAYFRLDRSPPTNE